MNRYFIIIIFITVLFTACSSSTGETTPPLQNKPPSIPNFTAENAKTAYKVFNKYFYNENDNLYYSSIDQSDIAGNWTQAIFLEMVMDHYKETNDVDDINRINKICKAAYKAYSHFKWEKMKHADSFIYDDMLWWINALARAYTITKNETYLKEAKIGFKFVWDDAWNKEHGGIRWSWRSTGMTSSSNWPGVIAAIRLYRITGKQKYLIKAKKIYSWAKSNLYQSSTGRVADNTQPTGSPVFSDHTYDQGACVGASLMMYKVTNKESYLDVAAAATEYTKDKMCNTNEILPAEESGNQQSSIFKTITIHWIAKLIRDGSQDQFKEWMQKNANLAWANRDITRNLMYTDYTVSAPKGRITSFDASSGVELLQVIPPVKQ